MMPQARDFLDECAAIHAIVADLDEEILATPTQFKGWTPTDILTHLHVWNVAADRALTDAPGFQTLLSAIGEHMGGGGALNQFEHAWVAQNEGQGQALSGRAMVAAWHRFYPEMASRFGAADPAARVPWAGPDMSVRSAITARLMESWAHAQAIYDLLGLERVDHDRIRNIAVLGVNTYGWSFKVRGLAVPEPQPFVRLIAPSGAEWTFGDPSCPERVEGSATAFCQTVTQTRNFADVDLSATGANAQQWMAHAQCFAGGPHDPPPPGTRGKALKSNARG